MGELVVSSEELEEIRVEEEREEKNMEVVVVEEGKGEGEGSGLIRNNGLMRWERLLSRMVLRVLLVEADDSTRQIIAALLRKCSYRVVAVSDGLKAWEVLKGRPHNIDLILTEVDLPSISGYALLSLIMEHEICKNIPVIMMSSQDSVSTVYKCMLRGAADYLVKPIRRNELRNLWQHVWRKQSSLVGCNGPLDGSSRQVKAEGTSENNAASNHASGDNACIQSKENIEKGTDAQSSCAKPDMEADSAYVEDAQNLLQPLRKNLLTYKEIQMLQIDANNSQRFHMHENEAGGPLMAACNSSNTMVNNNVEAEIQRLKNANSHGFSNSNDILVATYGGAIDFMGAASNHDSRSNNVQGKPECSPHLDLSLRGSHSSGFEIHVTEERNTLRHSSASAFTRYTSKGIQPLYSTLASSVIQVVPGANSDGRTSTNLGVHISSTCVQAPSTQRSIISLANGQTKESELATFPEQRVIPIQVPVEGMTFNNLCLSYGSVFPPIFCRQSGSSPTPSPSSACQQDSAPKDNPYHHSNFESNSVYLHHCPSRNTNDSTNQNLQKQGQEHKLDSLGDNGHISPTTDQSANSSFCNGALSRLTSVGHGSISGSNSNHDQVATVRAAAENKNEENILPHNPNSHRSIQREAALTKFRLKRKDRCYEKKVRYESRKKLAEQRPRVKGQFIRQAQVDTLPADAQ